MGIFKDIKKAFKGDEAFQKRKKGPISKVAKKVKGAVKGIAKDVKSAAKGSKEYQAGKAKKKAAKAKKIEGKVWKRATQRAKKSGGPNMSTLIKARGMHKKGSDEYNKIQNQINKNMGSRVRHQGGGMIEPPIAPTAPSISPSPAYEEGGKVEASNPYGWPTKDTGNGGK